jgi:hypothetical protein
MNTSRATEAIGQDRRRILGTAAMGIAVTGAASLIPSQLNAAPAVDSVYETLTVRKEDSDLFGEASRNPETQNRFQAAFKRGFQTRDAEFDLARLLGELMTTNSKGDTRSQRTPAISSKGTQEVANQPR